MTSPFHQYACWSIERDSLRVKYQATRSSDFPPLMLLKYSIASALGFCSFLIPKLSCAFTKNTENWVRLPIHAIRSKRLLATDLADKGKEGEQRLAKFLIPRFKNNFLKNIDYGISQRRIGPFRTIHHLTSNYAWTSFSHFKKCVFFIVDLCISSFGHKRVLAFIDQVKAHINK